MRAAHYCPLYRIHEGRQFRMCALLFIFSSRMLSTNPPKLALKRRTAPIASERGVRDELCIVRTAPRGATIGDDAAAAAAASRAGGLTAFFEFFLDRLDLMVSSVSGVVFEEPKDTQTSRMQ